MGALSASMQNYIKPFTSHPLAMRERESVI